MLSKNQLEENWSEIKSGLRTLWGKISEDEIEEVKGNLTDVLILAEQRYSETKEEIRKKFDQLMDSFENETNKQHLKNQSSFERRPDVGSFQDDYRL